jgi:hypothetical protein
MFTRTFWLVGLVALLMPVLGSSNPPPTKPLQPASKLPLLDSNSQGALAAALRGLIVQEMPQTLYEKSPGWGKTAYVPHAVTWHGKVLPLHPEVKYAWKNDGTWRKVRVTAANLADNLVFELRDVQHPEPGRMTFTLCVALNVHVHYEQQNWKAGVRLYSGSAEARLRVKATLSCEAVMKVESGKSWLPDLVFRLRVLKADVGYDNLVVEHVAGVGGTTAKIVGDAVKNGLHRWRPSLERKLLDRANAAVVKGGDNKEVRISLSKVLTTGSPKSP